MLASKARPQINRLLEPVYGRLRRVLPDLGGIDLAPLVALLIVYGLKIIATNTLYGLH